MGVFFSPFKERVSALNALEVIKLKLIMGLATGGCMH